ncbi:bacterioferritin-associated ferredoxin [Arsukibacterium sp.]|uniref:bacterioferritin-associated ferredoxin n=1 Tax=Arsukibacterium sp. TaxID=1977258 RepID=UPI00299D6F30|nr:bacterioferritin-associated ferredoxin [Arsukibacterium sp.]MDX1536197.1 bacterioferritin-associated ferredoxin [Arsukibacterium sp.]
MYVCLCKAVSDKAIKQNIANGACTMRDLKANLGVGSQCGKCVSQASAILHNELVKQCRDVNDLAKPAA